jgi:hypothetical protein
MGFDVIASNNNNPSPVPPASIDEPVSLKISFGNEIRRLTIPDSTYNSLCEKTASLFGIDQSSVSLKYQDDDDDKISMVNTGIEGGGKKENVMK